MEEIKFCPKCGHQLNSASNFCENCGFQVKENEFSSQNPFANQMGNPFEEPKKETVSGTPIVEKTKYSVLNYSQILRSNVFMNPSPLWMGLIGFLACTGLAVWEALVSTEGLDIYFYLMLIFGITDLISLFVYLIVNPLRAINIAKKTDVQDYHISFFHEAIHYQMAFVQRGRQGHTDIVLNYSNIYKFHEFKDMTVLLFIQRGMRVPICILHDEYYPEIKKLLQHRFDELRPKK